MRRLFWTIFLTIVVLNIGAHIGREKMNKFNTCVGNKIIQVTKNATNWAKEQWNTEPEPESE